MKLQLEVSYRFPNGISVVVLHPLDLVEKKEKKDRSNKDVLVKLVLFVLFLGGVAAAVTNPLDVAKTRVMLAPVKKRFF